MSEYDAALTAAALFNRSEAAKLVLTGPDAPMFLGNLCTNDIKNLPLGGGCEAMLDCAGVQAAFESAIGLPT